MRAVRVGIIGCGSICDVYLQSGKRFDVLDITACADIMPGRAEEKAREFGIARACSVAELLGDPEIEIILNLTTPHAHAEVALAALEAGKSVYGEKPLAVSREDGHRILETARVKGLRVGCAPDTFLGAGLQTCRKLIDEGAIGEPVAATAFMMSHGHEGWHPNPEFFYKAGGGPLFDMGPYYLTALVHLMGPVRRVTSSARITFPERTITSKPKRGQKIKVETPTHVAGVLDFAGGAVVGIITSFDVWGAHLPQIEIYGTEGTMSVPNPNIFGGPIRLRRAGEDEWEDVAITFPYAENSRALGLADMAAGLDADRPHRASGDLAFHVLEIMEGIHVSSDKGRHVELKSPAERPAPLRLGLPEWVMAE